MGDSLKVRLRFPELEEFEAKLREVQMKLDLARDLVESAKQAADSLPEISVDAEPSDDSTP